MSRYSLFRDDDISVTTDIGLLIKAHELVTDYGGRHAVALLMKDLWDNKEVWLWLMTTPNLVVGLHGWTHRDYSVLQSTEIIADIELSLTYWREHIGAYPEAPQIDTFFPPWNRSSPALERACYATGLKLDTRWKKDSDVYGFHSWELILPERRAKLVEALES